MKRKAVSATYMSSFTQCLQKFYFKYHTDKSPVMSGEARAFGSAVHEALEEMYTRLSAGTRLPTEEDYEAVYKSFLESALSNQLSDQSLYEEGRVMLKSRLDTYDPQEKIVGLELKFGWPNSTPKIDVFTPGGTPLMGAIDKLCELDEDTIVITDYKTSRTALTDSEAAVDGQLSLYDLVISILYPQYKNRILVLDYLRLGPVITHRTNEQREWFSKKLDILYDQIDKLTEDDIKPRLNEFCGWCDFKNHCPAYYKVINDPDLLVKPLETYKDTDFVEEWVRINHTRRMVENYKNELAMHASSLLRDTGNKEIIGEGKTLYKVQSSRVYYDSGTVLDVLPKKDAAKVLSVNKSAVDKYLVDHPEFSDAIAKTAKVSFASSFLKSRTNKKK